jgi:hypothetical protein
MSRRTSSKARARCMRFNERPVSERKAGGQRENAIGQAPRDIIVACVASLPAMSIYIIYDVLQLIPFRSLLILCSYKGVIHPAMDRRMTRIGHTNPCMFKSASLVSFVFC